LGEKWGLTVRAGVASGPTVLGVLGSHYKMEFQAIGRTVNLASRLQGQAQPGQVTASLDCAKAAGLDLGGLAPEQAGLKGFSQPESFVRLRVTLQE
ncbi:MAG: adenylate/guanylate cyclase domain-containing protein, partial [Planctomycetaceae bacterium]|nr:adenylate/guanylate cyclase domain-containing protein [Planctomycetaceae bacterium]